MTPTSLEDWKSKRASTKLNILAQVTAHHLARDNTAPVKIQPDGQTLEFDTIEHAKHDGKQEPDRIIIFSLFPSSNTAITEVSFI